MATTKQNEPSIATGKFIEDERGAITVTGLFFFLGAGMLGALALDVTSLFAARTHLQVAADQAAHTAIYNRAVMDADTAKARALAIVETTLPNADSGVTLTADDIEFGYYDSDTGDFVADPDATSAVRVSTAFLAERSNGSAAYLFRLLGYDSFDIVTTSEYRTYRPGCLREGFIANDVVDIQSNNAFGNGFCIHSNEYVSLNSNNVFEAGTVVSMPSLDDLDLPKSGFDTNEGLSAALREGNMNIRVLSRIDNIIYSYLNYDAPDSSYPDPFFAPAVDELPEYINNTTPVEMRERKVETADLDPGYIYNIECIGGSGLTIDATTTLRNVIIISPCEIKFSSGSSVEDVRVISTATSSDSINSPSGFRIGRDDNCGVGGGAQLITNGGMRFPADLQIFGSQLLAKGDITFAANANGVQGASMIAGGEINGTSNMNMGLCGTGMEDNIEIDYYRMSF